ncbi:uncharacterized protein EDB91DRAFT_1252174 [Suillus paluster]|uniref:uncharacterized protein n=1 Tax=Suillus paluster TaxID=48578 RepID=UPI001B86DE7D|nr:uncharacterized protein EDB91DRAFT_1252174 [Suillus paluster]KAG1731313.1 hypothetical protein EDB91DRAFT_1252174 [Suillus paluster]
MIHRCLKKDPTCTIDSLGSPSDHDDMQLRQLGPLQDELPDFTIDEMHRQLVKFIIVDDQAINLIECPEFCRLIRLLQPELNDSDICHRTKLWELILDAFDDYFEALKSDLAKAQGKILFTSDCEDWTNVLVLKAALIAFHHTPGSHAGDSLGSSILGLLDRANSGHFTLNNAGNNHTSMQELSHLLESRGVHFHPVKQRIPCFPHIINICVRHVLDDYWKAKFLGVVDRWVVEGKTIDKDTYVEAIQGKALDRVRLLIRTIRTSDKRHNSFRVIITMGNDKKWFQDDSGAIIQLPVVQLLHDKPTRWDSTYCA